MAVFPVAELQIFDPQSNISIIFIQNKFNFSQNENIFHFETDSNHSLIRTIVNIGIFRF